MGLTDEVKRRLETVSDQRIPGLGGDDENKRESQYQQPIRRAHREFEKSWNVMQVRVRRTPTITSL